jgi:hypothetical protein
MKAYFLRWLAKVKNLKVVPSDRVFLLEISRHFPETVQHSLQNFGDGTIASALRTLDEEDDIVNETLKDQSRDQQTTQLLDNTTSRKRLGESNSWRSSKKMVEIY